MIGVKRIEIFLQFESGTWEGGGFLGQISPVSVLQLYSSICTSLIEVLYWYSTIHTFIDIVRIVTGALQNLIKFLI